MGALGPGPELELLSCGKTLPPREQQHLCVLAWADPPPPCRRLLFRLNHPAPLVSMLPPLRMQAVALVQQEGSVGTAGCVVGVLAGAAMLSVMIQRVQVRRRAVTAAVCCQRWAAAGRRREGRVSGPAGAAPCSDAALVLC